MTERRTRWALEAATGALWTATIGAAMSELHIKVYLALWLATLLVSRWTLAVWMTRSDHDALGAARAKIELARLQSALIEEAELQAEARRPDIRLDHAAGGWR